MPRPYTADMRRRTLLTAVVAVWSLLSPSVAGQPAIRDDRFWYAPNPGSIDLIRMFERPEEWRRALQLIDVYQFTQQHTGAIPDRIVGPNRYDALVRADVFRTLVRWKKKIALGVGSVKEQYCTPGPSGMQQSIADTLNAIALVHQAGGTVSYLAMDEPFLAGRFTRCADPTLDATADRLRTYMTAVNGTHPSIGIGLIEAYPSFTPDQFAAMLDLTRRRGVLPAFLQVDVDIRAVRPPPRNDFANDMRRLKQIAADFGIPFGIIIWGYNGEADALFSRDAKRLADAFRLAFPTWEDVPDQLSVQSWSESATGLFMTPSNLPEDQPYTLTSILLHTHRRWIGDDAAASTGRAVRR